MAKIKLKSIFSEIKRSIGGIVFRRLRDQTVMSRKLGKSRVPVSEATQRQRERFREAAKFARNLTTEQKAQYAKIARKKKYTSVYQAALSEYLREGKTT